MGIIQRVQNVMYPIVTMMDFVLLTPKKLRRQVYVYLLVVRKLLFARSIIKNGKKRLKMIDH